MDNIHKGHSRPSVKYTKTEMKEYCKSINKMVYVGDRNLKEKFKQVKFKGIYYPYIISSFGRLFSVDFHSIPGCVKEMATYYDKDGYCRAALSYKGTQIYTRIHILVAQAFIKNPDKKHKNQVNHIDGTKWNNIVTNLEWVTNSENQMHALQHGLKIPLSGEDVWLSIYTDNQIKHVCEMLEKNKSVTEIMKATNVTNYLINDVLHHRKWKHISKNYDFSNYHFGKDVKTIRKICELLESNLYTQTEIARMTNTDVRFVHGIRTGHAHKEISKDYDFSNFNKYRLNK